MAASCTSCRAEMSADDHFCTSCGQPASAPPTDGTLITPSAEPTTSTKTIEPTSANGFCTACAAALGPGQDFCTSCGAKVDSGQISEPASASSPLAEANQPKGRALRLAGLVVGAVVVLGLAGFGLLNLLTGAEGEPGNARTESADDDSDRLDQERQEERKAASEPTTTTRIEPTTTSEALAPSSSATIDAVVTNVQCSTGGTALRGTITGVEDWVTMRISPALTADELDLIPAQAEVAYFPDSVQQGLRFEWMEISANGTCGWVASKFIKNVGGQVVGGVDAIDYVHRALRGLEPEALYGTWTHIDRVDPDDRQPVDVASLQVASERLRQLYLSLGEVDSTPDLSFGSGEPGLDEGCLLSDFLHCGVILITETGREIGRVAVSYLGDGISIVNLDLP